MRALGMKCTHTEQKKSERLFGMRNQKKNTTERGGLAQNISKCGFKVAAQDIW